jgi:hypothetical protein
MDIRISNNKRRDSKVNPVDVREMNRQRLERNKQGYDPNLTEESNQKSLVELLRKPSLE